MSEREIYVNAPLRLVAVEFRFPFSPAFLSPDVFSVVARKLGEQLPIVEPAAPPITILTNPGAVPGPMSLPGGGAGIQLLTQNRATGVTVSPGRLAVETTNYRRWEDLRRLIENSLREIGDELGAIPGLNRVGLRYVNEIRVPGDAPNLIERWRRFIQADLLAGLRFGGGEFVAFQSVLHFRQAPTQEVVMRSGIADGHVVGDFGPLRLPTPAGSGPFFLLDIDSFWTRGNDVPEYNTADALKLVDELHSPIDDLFESVITDELRDEVLRRPT